jgi:hypothetical protein
MIVIKHRRFSIINNDGVETDPHCFPGHLVWGVKQTTGGSTPPPAIQTLNSPYWAGESPKR